MARELDDWLESGITSLMVFPHILAKYVCKKTGEWKVLGSKV
jgi:hypothetical protein